MDELNATTPTITKSESNLCPNCGGKISYDIKSEKFLCESCRIEQKVELENDEIKEYSINDYKVRESNGKPLVGVSNATCASCGGEIYFDVHETAKQCPMCGSNQIRVEVAKSGIEPEGIIPFAIDKADAQERFRTWIVKRWFAPNLLKKSYNEGRLEGLYVPFWTYDADACATYFGQGGRTRIIRERDGKTREVVDWFPVGGTVFRQFDDILVCASQKQSGTIINEVVPFNTIDGLKPFTYQYLSGYKAERYSIDGLQCFRIAQQEIEATLRMGCESDVLSRGFDRARLSSVSTKYKQVTYKSVLVPMYKAQYGYGGKEYHYAINGQTGRVTGIYPKSIAKILLASLAAIVVFFMLMFAFGALGDEEVYDDTYDEFVVFTSHSDTQESTVQQVDYGEQQIV